MSTDRITYGDWTIHWDPPPIPIRTMDWHFTHRDYDASYEGEEDGYVSNGLGGSAESIEACKREIAEIEEDKGMPSTARQLVREMLQATVEIAADPPAAA